MTGRLFQQRPSTGKSGYPKHQRLSMSLLTQLMAVHAAPSKKKATAARTEEKKSRDKETIRLAIAANIKRGDEKLKSAFGGKPRTVSDLCAYLGFTKPGCAVMLKRREQRGVVRQLNKGSRFNPSLWEWVDEVPSDSGVSGPRRDDTTKDGDSCVRREGTLPSDG